MFNVIWGTKIEGQEAFAYVKGFPATFFLTDRRAILVGQFTEKMGWFRKKTFHRVIFEAGLQSLKDFKKKIEPTKKINTAHLTFHAHGDLAEDSLIQFMKIRPEIAKVIEEHVTNLEIKNPLNDTGIILIDEHAPPIQEWLNQRFGKKKGEFSVVY
jgi:hypothetical protein